VKYNFLCDFFYFFFSGQRREEKILTRDGSKDAESCKDVPFWGYKIKKHRSYDQNTEFRKFKMADGRHFENGFITIFQPKIIRFK